MKPPKERPREALANRFLTVVQPDMMAEYDAIRLRRKLHSLKRQGVFFSPEFLESSQLWFRDERNHYEGFNRLCAFLLGRTEQSVEVELAQGRSYYGKLDRFFKDELAICVIIAYDEIMTTRSYADDRELYSYLGPEPLDWFKLVIRDEANHLYNFVQVIKQHYSHRLKEAQDLISELVKIDLAGHTYERTFVMDRRSGNFNPCFIISTAEKLIYMLS